MPVESATYVADLSSSDPLAGDVRAQGDDHIRLLKTVLKTTFPNATKAFRFPGTMTQHIAGYTLLTADNGKVIPVSVSGGAVTITFPSSPDDGYHVIVVKTDTSANEVTLSATALINGESTQKLSWAYDAMLVWYGNSTWYGLRLGRQIRNRNLASGTNLNDVVSSGDYDGTTLTNAPSTGWWHVQVYAYSQSTSGSDVLQVATDLDTAGGLPYFRTKVGGSWGSWATFAQLTGANTFTGNNTYSGTSEHTKQANFTPRVSLTDASTIAWNLETAQVAAVTLNVAGATRSLGTPTNIKSGGTYILFVTQDSGGSRLLTYSSVYKWPGGTVPVLSTAANAVDILTFVSDGTNMYGVCQKAFS